MGMIPRATVDVPLTLHLSQEAQEKLVQQAAASGTDVASYVSKILEESARKSLSLEELSGPVYKRFLESGTTDDELSEELECGKHELRNERRSRRAS
jgi:uncharacterized protein (DUF1778 family)